MGTPVIGDILSIILSHKLLAYFLLLAFLAGDAFFSGLLAIIGVDFAGIVGNIVGWTLNQFGVIIPAPPTWQILILVALFPVIMFALSKSGD